MPWGGAGKLGGENGEVPEMRGVPVDIFFSKRVRIESLNFIDLPGGAYIGLERGN